MNKSIREQIEDLILEAQLKMSEDEDVSKDLRRGYCSIEIRGAKDSCELPKCEEERAFVYSKHYKT